MTELLCIAACLGLTALAFYHHHSVKAAYYQGRYDELIESQGWNKLQTEIAYNRGVKEGIDHLAKSVWPTVRKAYQDGRSSVIHGNFVQQN